MSIPEHLKNEYFFHFTHIDNLESIVKEGLLSTNEKKKLNIGHKDIANGNIQERRANMNVTVGPEGKVHDYVPFYFCTRNPMLLALVNSKNIDQELMIFIAIKIDKIERENVVFTNASANTTIPPNFYSESSELDFLNWSLIHSPTWGVENDEDRHSKMAEVLIHQKIKVKDIDKIICWNPQMKKLIDDVLEKNNIKINVTYEPINKRYFYYTKFSIGRGGETLTTGPEHLKIIFNTIEKSINDNRKQQSSYNFKTIRELIDAIEKDFCILKELEGIFELESTNEIHRQNVSDHTKKVVEKLVDTEFYSNTSQENKDLLLISAYLHDIGKGPKSKWKNEKQLVYPDHPVDSLKMLDRILTEEIDQLNENQIRMICLLVSYHDLIGEIIGKGRDINQLFELVKNEYEFEMLSCLNHADVLSFENGWSFTFTDSLRLSIRPQIVKHLGR